MDIKNITFVITTYRSENTIYECLNSLPQESPKIIIDNSNNSELNRLLNLIPLAAASFSMALIKSFLTPMWESMFVTISIFFNSHSPPKL